MKTFTNIQEVPEKQVLNELNACLLVLDIDRRKFHMSEWRDDVWIEASEDGVLVASMMSGMGYIIHDCTNKDAYKKRIVIKYQKIIPFEQSTLRRELIACHMLLRKPVRYLCQVILSRWKTNMNTLCSWLHLTKVK